jgi:hypothetical protein
VAASLVRADAWLDGGDEPGGVAGTPPPAVHLGVLSNRVVDDEDVIGAKAHCALKPLPR